MKKTNSPFRYKNEIVGKLLSCYDTTNNIQKKGIKNSITT